MPADIEVDGAGLQIGHGWATGDPARANFLVVSVNDHGALMVASADLNRRRVLSATGRYVWPNLFAVDDVAARIFYVIFDTPDPRDAPQMVGVYHVANKTNQYFNWIPSGYQLNWLLEYLPRSKTVVGHLHMTIDKPTPKEEYATEILLGAPETGDHFRYRLGEGVWCPININSDEERLIYRGHRTLFDVDLRGTIMHSVPLSQSPQGVSFYQDCGRVIIGGKPLRQWDLSDGSITTLLEEGYQPLWDLTHKCLWYLCPSTVLHMYDVEASHDTVVARLLGDWHHRPFGSRVDRGIVADVSHQLLFIRLGGSRPITDPSRLAAIRAHVGETLFEEVPDYSMDHLEIWLVVDTTRREVIPLPRARYGIPKIIGGPFVDLFGF